MRHNYYPAGLSAARTGERRLWPAAPIQLTMATLLLAQAPALRAQQQGPEAGTDSVEAVIVTGTRSAGARVRDSAAPIAVISAETLQETGASNLFDAMTALVPSYNSQSVTGNVGNMIRSVQLRGLSPNHVLVLVNGKRRHITASISADSGPNQYAAAADLDLIPVSAIDHVEVLQDGAAAQYGSDAIAGVFNVILKASPRDGTLSVSVGSFGDSKVNPHHEHNGLTRDVQIDHGFKWGEHGFAHLSAQVRDHDFTNQTGADLVTTAGFGTPLIPRSPKSDPFPSKVAGDARTKVAAVALNAGRQVAPDTEFYTVATAAYREAATWQNWRTPFQAPVYYPDGFEPLLRTREQDYALTLGVKGTTSGGWHWDLSSTYGYNDVALYADYTINRPLFRDTGSSPSSFYDGQYTISQWTNNADFTKVVDLGWRAPLNLALGLESRRESYSLGAGDAASRYDFGPDGFPGYALADAGTHTRRNIAAYVDATVKPSPQWLVSVAGREEHYSDFGNTFTAKLTSRYDWSQALAVRGTVSNGFRAPTLQEGYYSNTNVGPTYANVLLPTNSAAAALAGASQLKAEKSKNISLGLVINPASRLHATLDVYQITIRDRIIGSGTLSGPGANAAIVAHGSVLDPAIKNATVSYLTNGVDTRTRGLDATADYFTDFEDAGKVKWTASWNVNQNRIINVSRIGGLNPTAASPIIDATPHDKLVMAAKYFLDDWNANLRVSRYGTSKLTVTDGDTGGMPYQTNRISPTVIVDLELGRDLGESWSLSGGVRNLFNRFPDRAIRQGYSHAYVYPSFSPFGINGAYYYGRVAYRF
jgi:iron complex outermembrane receptor protein